jgi:hypothetical protein
LDNERSIPWKLEQLYRSPRVYPSGRNSPEGIHSIFYEGLPYKGKATRVFACYGLPETDGKTKIPAIVLVHGGGGTAYEEWVALWTKRGYAAIAMDLEGHVPDGVPGLHKWYSHSLPGPEREGIYLDCGLPVEDQWMYHAAADVILAHSLLRDIPQVDPERIGITGISWGGIVTSLVAGIDKRLAFAIPVYGCGFLYELNNLWGRRFAEMEEATFAAVIRQTEPSAFFSEVKIPMLWVNWLYDPYFDVRIFGKSYVHAKNGIEQSGLLMVHDLGHSHPSGWKSAEIYAFADSIVRGGEPLIRLGEQTAVDESTVNVSYQGAEASKALLYYTNYEGDWHACKWQTAECELDHANRIVIAELPQQANAYFINVCDHNGYQASTVVEVRLIS